MSDEEFDYPDREANLNAVAFSGATGEATGSISQFADLRRQRTEDSSFAPERLGNQVKAFTTGEDYFSDVFDAISAAKTSVFILGWQVNWAVRLKGDKRLIDALKAAVDHGARVYVMPWLSPKVGVNTGDFGTMLAVFSLNAGRAEPVAFCCPAGLQNDYSGIEESFFSHHQKLVVVDNKIAYVGGIDLAFGRRDDASFSLAHGWRTGPEVYNSGIPAMQSPTPGRAANYVEESELLATTLTPTALNEVMQWQDRARNVFMAGRASPMAPVNWVHNWWHSPSGDFMLWLGDRATQAKELATTPLEPALRAADEAKQAAADSVIRRMRQGSITEGNVQELISVAKRIAQVTYNGLVLANWTLAKPNKEVLRAGSQSMPHGGKEFWARQPRMPWQDVEVRIEGPSVYDLAMNFIRRWNSLQAKLGGAVAAKAAIGATLMPPKPAEGVGNGGQGGMKVDVLRSASVHLQRDEVRGTPGLKPPAGPQREIHDAMVSAILNAERFIYIENQFFQSGFGEPSIAPENRRLESAPMRYLKSNPANRIQAAVTQVGAGHALQLPRNHIARAIGDRIEDAIRWDQPFHAYLVLPVHPEGSLADMAIVGQIHWTMQSLVFARESLLNRVRLALYARRTCKDPRNSAEWVAAKDAGLEELDSSSGKKSWQFQKQVPTSAVNAHLTLLNLRSCQTISGAICTEQAYVHSKLLIVDDTTVIVGSANVNDRSLHGGRDSELAVCITDTATKRAPIDGRNPVVVRTFAHELRKSLWAKHFGLRGGTDLVKPANDLSSILDKPAAPGTWQAIQAVAKANAALYAQAFDWTPRADLSTSSSLWPVWPHGRQPANIASHYDVGKELAPYADRMPFSEAFWRRAFVGKAPSGLRGYITELPLNWTEGENNHPEMNMILLTERATPPQTSGELAASNVASPAENASSV